MTMTSATAQSTLPPVLPKARRAPSLWRAAVLIFDLSLARMLWSRGIIFMGLLVGLPVVGHVPESVAEIGAVDSGMRSIEHAQAAAGAAMSSDSCAPMFALIDMESAVMLHGEAA